MLSQVRGPPTGVPGKRPDRVFGRLAHGQDWRVRVCFGVEAVRQDELIETLKKLIQGDKALVRQMRRTIEVVDRKLDLHRKIIAEARKNPQSGRDNR